MLAQHAVRKHRCGLAEPRWQASVEVGGEPTDTEGVRRLPILLYSTVELDLWDGQPLMYRTQPGSLSSRSRLCLIQ